MQMAMDMTWPAERDSGLNESNTGSRGPEEKRQWMEEVDADRQAGHAIAILDATVRSLSSFALFFSKACCLQLSRFWQLWCSGMRC